MRRARRGVVSGRLNPGLTMYNVPGLHTTIANGIAAVLLPLQARMIYPNRANHFKRLTHNCVESPRHKNKTPMALELFHDGCVNFDTENLPLNNRGCVKMKCAPFFSEIPNDEPQYNNNDIKLQSRPTRRLISPIMPNGHFHLERITTVAQILRDEHSRLLTNEQRGAVRVTAHVVRADREVSALETLDAMDVEARVEDTIFDDAIALTGSHAACTQTFTNAS